MIILICSLGVPSYTQKIADLLEAAAEYTPDVRTYLSIHRSLRREYVFLPLLLA
jgi:hypothetical protein